MEIWAHTKKECVSKLSALNNAQVLTVLHVLCPWDHQQHSPQCGITVGEPPPDAFTQLPRKLLFMKKSFVEVLQQQAH